MKTTFPHHFARLCLLLMIAGSLLTACAAPTAVVDTPASPTQGEPVVVTTDAPAEPTVEPTEPPTVEPTEAATTEPVASGCPLTAEPRYVNEAYGYCFAYPDGFTLDELTPELPTLAGPVVDDGTGPQRAALNIFVRQVRAGAEANALAQAFLSQSTVAAAQDTIQRSTLELGGQPAELLSGVPGSFASRVVLAVNGEILYQLHFTPDLTSNVEADVNELFETVTGSFAFFEPAQPAPPAPEPAAFVEFGRRIVFQYDPTLALVVEAESLPAVPSSPEIMFSDAHPALALFRFLGYNGGQPFMLPYPFDTARLMAFSTEDFAEYGADVPTDFPNQYARLRELLDSQPDLAPLCDPAAVGDERGLPFLPWVNSGQIICAQPEYIEFSGGSGIRYLTWFSQGVSPAMDPELFYTFQGLTEDGEIYISAVLPVRSGVLPEEVMVSADGTPPEIDYPGQVAALQAVAEEDFQPALGTLDDLVSSIEVVKQ